MLKKKIGLVTEQEKEEIERLYERKVALKELMMTLNNPDISREESEKIYEKIVDDMGKTEMKFNRWWQEKAAKYQWKSAENGNWEIDFLTREIYLVA